MESAAVLLSACFPYRHFDCDDSGDLYLVRFAASHHERLNPRPGVIERKRLLICCAFYERRLCAIREAHLCRLRTSPPKRIRHTIPGRTTLGLRSIGRCAVGAEGHRQFPFWFAWPCAGKDSGIRCTLGSAFHNGGRGRKLAFSGYALFVLTRGLGFWPAAALLAFLFGGLHLASNAGENWLGSANLVIAGFLLAFTLQRTGNLWFYHWHTRRVGLGSELRVRSPRQWHHRRRPLAESIVPRL